MFKRMFEKIRAMFAKLKPKIEHSVERAVMITEAIKAIVSNPVFDALTALTPFAHDDKALAAIRSALPYVCDLLGIADASTGSPELLLSKISEVLEKRSPQFKKLFYRELAAALAHALADGKLSAWELFTLTQTVYRMLKDNELQTQNKTDV